MWTRWIPWKFLVKRITRAYGFIDPFMLLARMGRFSQPSEVQQPIELIRAGIQFHARGLINTRAIQHNLDWVWPYWVERQFKPNDVSFLPRAFTITHVNLTHRNWTAVGKPDTPTYPIVDPRGMVTPLFDGWSIDFWVIGENGHVLVPSRIPEADQHYRFTPNLAVETRCENDGQALSLVAELEMLEGRPCLVLRATGETEGEGWLGVALRPYNPEGVQFIEEIVYNSDPPGWKVNATTEIHMHSKPERVLFSNYREGDVFRKLAGEEENGDTSIACDVGMATSTALFRTGGKNSKAVEISVPLEQDIPRKLYKGGFSQETWESALEGTALLKVPDIKICYLFDSAVRTLVLLSAHDIVPGPYTYRRFWFRDACFMINALLALGMNGPSLKALKTFPDKQKRSGYFRSQEGEWDSNGQVLWILDRFQRMTRSDLDDVIMESVFKGARWISKKRISPKKDALHSGLLPAGFSAEHLGPNDYYYWDDFWGLAGLKGAARLAGEFHSVEERDRILEEARDFEEHIFRSISRISREKGPAPIPASPYRRMDAGAVGSLVADYPLQITSPKDPRIALTADFLLENCFYYGGFFQDMIHSGINAYLTLSIAQTLLRNSDSRYKELIETVAEMASPTGQWPEAIHPLTGGGCMGDGQHGWAAAEWVMIIRNLFVREEGDRKIILGSGIFPEWLEQEEELSFGPTQTQHGPLTVRIKKQGDNHFLRVEGRWHGPPPVVEIDVPGTRKETGVDLNEDYRLSPNSVGT